MQKLPGGTPSLCRPRRSGFVTTSPRIRTGRAGAPAHPGAPVGRELRRANKSVPTCDIVGPAASEAAQVVLCTA